MKVILKAILNAACLLVIDLHKCLYDSDLINITCNVKGFVGKIFTAFHLVSIYQQRHRSDRKSPGETAEDQKIQCQKY